MCIIPHTSLQWVFTQRLLYLQDPVYKLKSLLLLFLSSLNKIRSTKADASCPKCILHVFTINWLWTYIKFTLYCWMSAEQSFYIILVSMLFLTLFLCVYLKWYSQVDFWNVNSLHVGKYSSAVVDTSLSRIFTIIKLNYRRRDWCIFVLRFRHKQLYVCLYKRRVCKYAMLV